MANNWNFKKMAKGTTSREEHRLSQAVTGNENIKAATGAIHGKNT